MCAVRRTDGKRTVESSIIQCRTCFLGVIAKTWYDGGRYAESRKHTSAREGTYITKENVRDSNGSASCFAGRSNGVTFRHRGQRCRQCCQERAVPQVLVGNGHDHRGITTRRPVHAWCQSEGNRITWWTVSPHVCPLRCRLKHHPRTVDVREPEHRIDRSSGRSSTGTSARHCKVHDGDREMEEPCGTRGQHWPHSTFPRSR